MKPEDEVAIYFNAKLGYAMCAAEHVDDGLAELHTLRAANSESGL